MADTALYTHLVPEVIQNLPGTGSQRLIEKLLLQDIPVHDAEAIAGEIFAELLLALEEGTISPQNVLDFLSEAIVDDLKASMFCHTVNVFPLSEPLKELITTIHTKQAVIQPATLASYLDASTLSALGIVPAQALTRQLNTKKRDEFYTQRKYNLFHEEFQGYAVLVHELFDLLRNGASTSSVPYALRIVESMIGHYHLDPNRVLSVCLDVFAECIVNNQEFMVQFFKQSRWWPDTPADSISGLEFLNKGGSEAAAKLIGLKYLRSDPYTHKPYMIMVSILMKIGFVSFGSIYSYLGPDDTEMASLETLYKKELENQVFRASASALALAAPLEDEEDEGGSDKKTPANGHSSANSQQTVHDKLKTNIKYHYLKAFLSTGLYWPAVYILSKFPFLVHVDYEVPALMLRLLEAMVVPLYETVCDIPESLLSELSKEKPVANVPFLGKINYTESHIETYYTLTPPSKPPKGKKAVYFYHQWKQKIPAVTTLDELYSLSRQYVKFLGVHIAEDSAVFLKICEILSHHLGQMTSREEKEDIFCYFRNYIFPAMGATKENAVAVSKAYAVLKFFPVEDRFNLYGELYQVLAKNHAHVKISYGGAEKATKDTLKRLSKENVMPMMKRLAKISCSNPLPCLLTILQQLESYDNLNTLVVQTANYFNEYTWDNLTLAILMRLTALGRSNTQADGLHERQWIQSLASFIGQICHEYPNRIDLSTIIVYIMKSFHQNEVSCLLVLREILAITGGFKAITNLTARQINMINGSLSLRKIVYKTIGDSRYESKKPGTLLLDAISKLDALNEMFVLLARLNKSIVFGTEYSHLKLLANKNDDVDSVMRFFTTLVNFFGTNETKSKLIPINDLVQRFDVPLAWAFELWRSYLVDTPDLARNICKCIPSGVSPDLFCWFWRLRLYDINYDENLYDSELKKLKSSAQSLKEQFLVARKDRDLTRERFNEMKNDIVVAEDSAKDTPEQKEEHREHDATVTSQLKQESSSWFKTRDYATLQKEIRVFIQTCILPRSLHSSFDAVYGAKFIIKLHELRTENYSAAMLMNELFTSQILFATLFTCTPTEAENLGIFFAELLKIFNSLRDENTYKKLTENSYFFANDSFEVLSLDDYKRALFSWHSALLKDISRALTVTDYMSRRNCILFLKNLVGVYPNVEDHCEEISSLIENISKNEKREDLILSASALIGHVKSRASTWVHMWDFCPLSEEEKQEQMKRREDIENARKQKEEEERKKKEEAARKIQEEQEKKRREQQKARLDKEAAEKQKASASALSYDDNGIAKSRQPRAPETASKGRYDRYSRDVLETKDSKEPKDSKETKEAEETAQVKDSKAKKNTPAEPKGEAQQKPPKDSRKEENRDVGDEELAKKRKKFDSLKKDDHKKNKEARQPVAIQPPGNKTPSQGKQNSPKPQQSREKSRQSTPQRDEGGSEAKNNEPRDRFLRGEKPQPKPAKSTQSEKPAETASRSNQESTDLFELRVKKNETKRPEKPQGEKTQREQPQRERQQREQLVEKKDESSGKENARTRFAQQQQQQNIGRGTPDNRGRSSYTPSQPQGQRRPPLPPQHPPQHPRDQRDKDRNDFKRLPREPARSGYNARGAAPVPPPLTPPPPPPPPSAPRHSSDRGDRDRDSFRGRDKKRGPDSYRGRGYDKRPRY